MNVNGEMLKLFLLAHLCIGVAGGCSTPQPAWKRFVQEQIPITVQKGEPTLFQVHVRHGSNFLGIQCAPELWQTLTNGGTDKISIQLVTSSHIGTDIYGVRPGRLLPKPQSEGGGLAPAGFALFTNTQYLCAITGKHKGTATVEITFPGGPNEPSAAEIIVSKLPDDLKMKTILGF
ncbi:MAG TPA: hypothetical protein VFZ59_20990 [Verrucomicrobiae bacterium]|nr:hypothetical protein [Verrucomicrobiae bacterium]